MLSTVPSWLQTIIDSNTSGKRLTARASAHLALALQHAPWNPTLVTHLRSGALDPRYVERHMHGNQVATQHLHHWHTSMGVIAVLHTWDMNTCSQNAPVPDWPRLRATWFGHGITYALTNRAHIPNLVNLCEKDHLLWDVALNTRFWTTPRKPHEPTDAYATPEFYALHSTPGSFLLNSVLTMLDYRRAHRTRSHVPRVLESAASHQTEIEWAFPGWLHVVQECHAQWLAWHGSPDDDPARADRLQTIQNMITPPSALE